jgi:hypothetical protein
MAAPHRLPSTPVQQVPAAIHDVAPFDVATSVDEAVPGDATYGASTASSATDDADPTPAGDELSYWAHGLLHAVVAADTTDDGEPVLAAAGNAATAALLLIQYHQRHDGDLSELFDVTADQLAIVRELVHAAPSARPPEPAPVGLPAAPVPPRPGDNRTRLSTGGRNGRRRLRLVRSSAH